MIQLLRTFPANSLQTSLILCAGFEERASKAAEILHDSGCRPSRILLLEYYAKPDDLAAAILKSICQRLVGSPDNLKISTVDDDATISKFIADARPGECVICDITGMSRVAMFFVLTLLLKFKGKVVVVYTEAEEYYPLRSEFDHWGKQDGLSLFDSAQHETAAVVYSTHCVVEDVSGFPGRHLPNYPLLLIGFLTFKRSRLSAVLQEFEANSRILVKGVPVRDDLKWRERAMEIINSDLIIDNKSSIVAVTTLDWKTTFELLVNTYKRDNNRYRYNILLAPLGSKMQTVGAWRFAVEHPSVRVVTSTPKQIYTSNYSRGARETFVITDVFECL